MNNYKKIINNDFKQSYQWKIWKVISELVGGFELISNFNFNKTITVWGSARIKSNTKTYKKIEKFGEIAAKQGYTIVTGGSDGLMEAANKGCYENGGESIGINVELPKEQGLNKYLTDSITLKYFFVRKMLLSFISKHYVFAPGGTGTFDEFFEILTLATTEKMGKKVNIILIDKKFWKPFLIEIENIMIKKYKTFSKKELDICQVVDTPEEALEIIKNN